MGARGQIRYGREIDAHVLRDLVGMGCCDRESLHQGVLRWCENIGKPCSLKIQTIDRWAQAAVDSGHIMALQQGSVTEQSPRSGGTRTIPAYRFFLPKDEAGVLATIDPKKLRLAKWGEVVSADTIWQAVAAGAFDRFTLADWLNSEFAGYAPISPNKAEEWAQYAAQSGAIIRHPLLAGKPPYVHAFGAYRAKFHRFTLGDRPEQPAAGLDDIEQCREIMIVFGLLPDRLPQAGIGRLHRMEDSRI
jgi:hypothetical protein